MLYYFNRNETATTTKRFICKTYEENIVSVRNLKSLEMITISITNHILII